jgi:1-acyl-sn-glycerol-3-phosphate acyltransferase
MESLMETLVGRRANKDAGLIPFFPPTYAQVRRFFGDLVHAIYRLEVVGADRLPVTGPMVVAPNHESVLDGIVLGAAISRELRFLAKAELWRSRLLAWVLDGLGAIRIERGRGDQFALMRVRQSLDAGQAVAIFPRLRVIVGEPIEVARATEGPVAATELTERLRIAVESLA